MKKKKEKYKIYIWRLRTGRARLGRQWSGTAQITTSYELEKKKKPSYFSYYKLVTDRCRLNPITIINGIGTSEKCLLNRLLIDNNNKSLSRRYIRKQY